MVLYGGTYMGGDLPLTIGAIQVTHDGVVALALEHGGINLLMPGGETLKADPFEGDPRLRWLFSYNGVLLIAG
jgi:hypothetical protein